jgi:hypothetical protein
MEINSHGDLLKAYMHNFSLMAKVCEQTLALSAHVGDTQTAGYCYMILIQIRTLLESVKSILEDSEETVEQKPEKGYDLIDLWKHMGGDSE